MIMLKGMWLKELNHYAGYRKGRYGGYRGRVHGTGDESLEEVL